jgi:hypothetical protein
MSLSNVRESDAKVMTPDQIRARGWAYWQKIYTSGSQGLLDGMHRGYPDMGRETLALLLANVEHTMRCPMYTVP